MNIPAKSRKPLFAGFTMIEVLVVVSILALAAGVAFVVVDGGERALLDREARRFAGALEYAAQRAQMRHETLGVSATEGTWRFWRRDSDGRWHVLSDDAPLAPRTLPAPLVATPLAYAGAPLPADAIVPLRPSGRNEPYTFALAAASMQAIVTADPLNRVVVTGAVAR